MQSGVLDERDLILLEELKRDSRTPFSRLAKLLGVTESAVRKRVRRLVEAGVIRRFTIEYTLPGELGAIILVKVRSPTPVPEVSKRIAGHRFVDRVVEVTGEYDIVAMARAGSVGEINGLIDYIRGVEGVAETYTMIILRTY
ncbi:MAG: Lrp/AsnC family transcriptional regulator [Desulfurococcales archaeon]|nr:Lrp/AsnC family transcriptional regulator [Desulfurococcales archaeon]